MSTCKKCNAILEDGTKFCSECGEKVQETVFCPSCGEQTSMEFAFCQKCGKPLSEPVTEHQSLTTQPTINTYQNNKKIKMPVINFKFLKNIPVKILAIALVAVIIISAVIIINPFKSKSNTSILYVKDNELNFTYLNKIKPVEITTSLTNGDNTTITQSNAQLESYLEYSDDGRYMLYPDKADGKTASLYFLDLIADNSKNDKAIKIDSDIALLSSNFKLSYDGKKVIYIKGDEKNLYYHNLKEKEKLDTNVEKFYVDTKCSVILYEKDNTIYKKEIGSSKEKVKVVSDASIAGVSEDLDKIYYIKDGSLNVVDKKMESKKIASDVTSLVARYDDSSLYFTKSDISEVSLSSFVTDELAESDAAMVEPMTQNFEIVDPDNTLYAAIDWDAYNAAKEKYNEKKTRDALRNNLNSEKIELTNITLYFYDGNKETVITDSLKSTYLNAKIAPVIVYTKYSKSEVVKIKISQIKRTADVKSLVDAANTSVFEYYIAIKEKENVFDQTRAQMFRINKSANKLYFIDDYTDEDSFGTLMEASINGGSISKPVKIDDDVNSFRFKSDGDSLIYFKDMNKTTRACDMYENKKSIATDVYINNIISIKNSSALVYFTDFSANTNLGTLNILNGSKPRKIADDVSSFVAVSEKSVVYITDYSKERLKGDAYLFNGSSKPVKVDTDVQLLIARK